MTPPIKDVTFDDLQEHRIEKNGAIAKLLRAQMAMVNFSGSEFMEKIWTENDMSNRHTAVPTLELLPEPIRNKHRGMFQYLKFFQTWIKPVAAEFVATWMLVFWACMLQPPPVDIAVSNSTGIGTGPDSNTDALAPALAAGINLIIIICMFWDICIIQFNPCVTVALVFAQVIPWRLLVPNILAQLGGATLAAYFASLLRGYPVGMIPLTDDSNLNAVFWAEFFFSFMMTFVAVMAILDPDFHHPLTPLVIGLTVTQGVLGGRYIGAGCMNPARVFGPAVIANDWDHHYIWWLGECLGAIFSVVLEALIFAPIVVSTDAKKTQSGLWWWQAYLWRHGLSSADRAKRFDSKSTWQSALSQNNNQAAQNSESIEENDNAQELLTWNDKCPV